MFNSQFFPTPLATIEQMLDGEIIAGKVFLEPEGGKGDIVDYLLARGAKNVMACEINDDLRKILATKCTILASDFLKVESSQISHIDYIVMNPPFNADEKHILHAYDIAPPGCKIIALCNLNTIEYTYFKDRRRMRGLVDKHGTFENLGNCFSTAERKTNVEVALVRLQKPGGSNESEFEGFFMDGDPEEAQSAGLMSYNVVRDLVHRYVMAVKVFDEQLIAAVKMREVIGGFYHSELSFTCSEEEKPKTRNEFKKDLQKSAWKYIFEKMNMQKYATQGLREDINKFVEKQEQVPFTMRNIYRMLEIIIGTNGQRMDKALMEVFEKVTRHTDENRFNVEGWKTNSNYLLNRKFIMPYCVESDFDGRPRTRYNGNFEIIEDLVKALCYLTGDNYDHTISLNNFISYPYKLVDANGRYIKEPSYDFDVKIYERDKDRILDKQKKHFNSIIQYDDVIFGTWFNWGYFKVKAFKKGTLHMEFLSEDLWAMFNQNIAKQKGFTLPEQMKPKKERKRQTAEAA